MSLPLAELVPLQSLAIETPVLLFYRNGLVSKWNLSSGIQQVVPNLEFVRHPSVHLSPEGRWVTYYGETIQGAVQYWLYDKLSGANRQYREITDTKQRGGIPSFSPDGKWISRFSGGELVRLELYRMASPRDAYGIWSQYRYPDQEVLPIPPSEAIVSDTSADFFRGETFVRVRSKPGDGSRSDVVGIASEIVALIKGSGVPPEEARALDDLPGRVSGSIHYQKRAMLGYECLAPGFEAKFSTASSSGHYLLLPPAADGGAARKARLARELPGYREVNPTLRNVQTPSGNMWMISEGGCVLAVAGKIPGDQVGPLLSSLAQRMREICRTAP